MWNFNNSGFNKMVCKDCGATCKVMKSHGIKGKKGGTVIICYCGTTHHEDPIVEKKFINRWR